VSAASAWPTLREAARAFAPQFEVVEERPGRLALDLRGADGGDELTLRYRSERGLFIRTYYLVVEAEVSGPGPSAAGSMALRRGKLRWKRPKPPGAAEWAEGLRSPDVLAALRRLQIERLGLGWDPTRGSWNLVLETLSGSVTVTFFPFLLTPNPLEREEAEAVASLLRALRQQVTRTPA
jgi:hypothetical protein